MAFKIKSPDGIDGWREFVSFQDRANESRSARWNSNPDLMLPILSGESPFAKERQIRPFVALQGGEIVARAAAVVDARYNRHWKQELGHIVWFESLPDVHEAVTGLMDDACAWLAQHGVSAARAGFTNGGLEFPFCMDAYEALPPSLLRQNPGHYHISLKRAGFEVEQGFVDYRARVTPELKERWESNLESARRAGFEIVPLRDLPPPERVQSITENWNESFKNHWGWVPWSEDEIAVLLDEFAETSLLDSTVVAYMEGTPAGFLFTASDDPGHATLAPGRVLEDAERLNVLAIGVRPNARGRGLNYAMGGYSLLELVRRGQTHISYTLVLDHNWPSRRTGEGLGATVCANYLAYRRNFRR